MNYLIENKEWFKNGEWRFPYWTIYKSDTPEGKVRQFLEASEGYCINCNGFDELLCLIGEELGYKMPTEENFLKDAKFRYKKLSEVFENILTNKSTGIQESGESDTKTLEQAVQTIMDGTDSFAKSMKAILLHNRGQYREALQVKKELIEKEPENAGYHDSLGVTLHEMKEYEEARKESEKAVELEPENAKYRDNLRVILKMIEESIVASVKY